MFKRIFKFYSLPMYIMVHPFDGFYNMKHLKEGSMKIALLNFFLVCLSVSIMNQYTSLRINDAHPGSFNSLWVFTSFTLALVLFCVSNWSVCAITDGEGKFKEIVMAVCYSLTPVILTFVPITIISNFLATAEAGFYTMVVTVAIGYTVLLIFLGLVSIHNFTASKAIITIILTIVALLIIVFLVSLLFSMWGLLIGFVRSIYTEVTFRS